MQAVGATTIDDFILDARGQREAAGGDVRQAGWLNTPIITAETVADERYTAAKNRMVPKRINSHLVLFDCITCDKCVPVCPNDANFIYETPPVDLHYRDVEVLPDGTITECGDEQHFVIEKKEQIANFADFCNHCGNCDTFCPEWDGPYLKKPNFFGSRASFDAAAAGHDGFFLEGEPGGFTLARPHRRRPLPAGRAIGDAALYCNGRRRARPPFCMTMGSVAVVVEEGEVTAMAESCCRALPRRHGAVSRAGDTLRGITDTTGVHPINTRASAVYFALSWPGGETRSSALLGGDCALAGDRDGQGGESCEPRSCLCRCVGDRRLQVRRLRRRRCREMLPSERRRPTQFRLVGGQIGSDDAWPWRDWRRRPRHRQSWPGTQGRPVWPWRNTIAGPAGHRLDDLERVVVSPAATRIARSAACGAPGSASPSINSMTATRESSPTTSLDSSRASCESREAIEIELLVVTATITSRGIMPPSANLFDGGFPDAARGLAIGCEVGGGSVGCAIRHEIGTGLARRGSDDRVFGQKVVDRVGEPLFLRRLAGRMMAASPTVG